MGKFILFALLAFVALGCTFESPNLVQQIEESTLSETELVKADEAVNEISDEMNNNRWESK